MNYKINNIGERFILVFMMALIASLIVNIYVVRELRAARNDIAQLEIKCQEMTLKCETEHVFEGEGEDEEETEKEEEIDAPIHQYFDVPLDTDLQDHIFAECEKYDIDPAIIVAMIERESRFDASVCGDSGRSFGLMQIQKKWHADRMGRLGADDLLNPYQNVSVGIDFMAELIEKGRGIEWALMAYNGGPKYANRMTNQGKISDYATNVLVRAVEFNG